MPPSFVSRCVRRCGPPRTRDHHHARHRHRRAGGLSFAPAEGSREVAERVAGDDELATAVGLFKSVARLVLVAIGYWLASKYSDFQIF